jgi:N-methylhydantoinase A
VSCRIREGGTGRLPFAAGASHLSTRRVYFDEMGWTDADVVRFETMEPDTKVAGPAIIESSFTTVVIDPGTQAMRTGDGGLRVTF